MTTSDSKRPQLSRELTGSEFLRWYWLKDELAEFARDLGVRTTGSKELLTVMMVVGRWPGVTLLLTDALRSCPYYDQSIGSAATNRIGQTDMT